MKNLVLILGMLFMTHIQAQLFPIPFPIKTKMIDQINKGNYEAIRKDHRTMMLLNTEHHAAVEAVTSTIIEKHDRLFIAGSPLIPMRAQIDNFINFDSRNYYYYKYPIASLYAPYPSDMFKNMAIRNRYNRKVTVERDNISYYLGKKKAGVTHELRIPEGERVLLTLQALGDIINLTLENEEY